MIKGKIKSIEYTNPIDYVYDITVENNHNFTANKVIVKNCHHIPSNTMSVVSSMAKDAYYRIGVSATPWRDDNADLLIEAALNKKQDELGINASKLIELGFLVPPTIYFVPMKQIFKGKNYHKLYTEAIVNNDERNQDIVQIAYNMKVMKKMTVLILIQRIEHGEKLLDMISKRIPIKYHTIKVEDDKTGKEMLVRIKNIEFLSGQDDALRRKAVLKGVKEKLVEMLIGSTIADEGLDLPNLDCLILAGGGRSSTRAFQRVGRVLRLSPGKTRAVVFDFEDYTPILRRHSKVRKKLYEMEPAWDIKYLNPSLLR